MNEIELILLLLVAVAALTPTARKLRVPYPVLLVTGGLILALLPIVPDIPLDPQLIFLFFLPPLVFRAAFTTSIRDFRQLLRPILSLAVGLVLATTAVVAVVLHMLLPELDWWVAFAFGAIVSPPDAVAAAAIFRGLGVSRKVVTILEGESLINDATALVTYGAALGATTVAFSVGTISMRFLVVGAGGVLIGLVAAVVIGLLRQRLNDPPVEVTLSLLTPFAAYLPAESLGVSGVLAAVTAGLYLGWWAPYVTRSETRLNDRAVWEMVDFLLNGLVFILIGLQLSTILPTLAGRSIFSLIGFGLVLTLAVIIVRLAWVFLDTYFQWWLARFRLWLHVRFHFEHPWKGKHSHQPPTVPNWRRVFVVGWAGMRGVVSLAVVLTLPAATPERNLLIFLTFFVILFTLVGQGLSLPWLIQKLGAGVDASVTTQQELHARRIATDAAMSRLAHLREEWPGHLPLIDTLQAQYDHRASHFGPSPGEEDGDSQETEEEFNQELLEHHQIRRAVIEAERGAVLDLRIRGEIDDEVWRQIERDLDFDEMRMDA